MKKKRKTPVIAGRVPQSLYVRIKRAAKKSGRSMSDEMAWRIGKSFSDEKIINVLIKAGFAAHRELRELKQKSTFSLEECSEFLKKDIAAIKQKSTDTPAPSPEAVSSPERH